MQPLFHNVFFFNSLFKINFFIFSNCFDVLILKIIFNIYYFDAF
jgi:hypothetical protein